IGSDLRNSANIDPKLDRLVQSFKPFLIKWGRTKFRNKNGLTRIAYTCNRLDTTYKCKFVDLSPHKKPVNPVKSFA
ncbi:MAG: hypothetical protein C5B58_10825, partial [Acidobacteria bacterium]